VNWLTKARCPNFVQSLLTTSQVDLFLKARDIAVILDREVTLYEHGQLEWDRFSDPHQQKNLLFPACAVRDVREIDITDMPFLKPSFPSCTCPESSSSPASSFLGASVDEFRLYSIVKVHRAPAHAKILDNRGV
jgi:hypothetical protein